jgi:hypothetical protein
MAIPGVYTLAALTITTAITAQRQTAITSLEGMSRAVIEAEFAGTGGSTVVALIRSRIGTGGTWREVASIDFSAAGAKSCTLVAGAAAVAAFATLSANSVLAGFLGSELEAVITTTGTWSSGVLTVRAHVS